MSENSTTNKFSKINMVKLVRCITKEESQIDKILKYLKKTKPLWDND